MRIVALFVFLGLSAVCIIGMESTVLKSFPHIICANGFCASIIMAVIFGDHRVKMLM